MTLKIGRILAVVLLIVLIIAIVPGFEKAKTANFEREHDIDDIKIKIVELRPEEKKYSNGTYYDWETDQEIEDFYYSYKLYLDHEIKNNSGNTLDEVDVTAHITDKNGKHITNIDSEFNNLALAKGDSVTLDVYLSRDYYDEDDSFFKLYEGDLSDLKITYEITYARWSDGAYYR